MAPTTHWEDDVQACVLIARFVYFVACRRRPGGARSPSVSRTPLFLGAPLFVFVVEIGSLEVSRFGRPNRRASGERRAVPGPFSAA